METADVVLHSETGGRGWLRIARLPSAAEGPELDDRRQLVTLREARTYRFELSVAERITRLEPAELFDADDATQVTGRLRPGEAVGLVDVRVSTSDGSEFVGRFDVRSAKFSDEQAFGSMLADLAALSVEALHQGFAPSAGQFGSASGPSPRLLYQQFAVLNALLMGPDLKWAVTQVLAQPQRGWETELEPRQPGRSLRGSSRLSAQLSRPGPRVLTPGGPLESLPSELLVQRTRETLDTLPNRFVRFVFEQWRALAATVVANASVLSGAPMRRGVSEAQRVVEQLDEWLGHPLFREVEALSVYPGDNQVLRRREGYRQIFAAAALVEGSLGLEIDMDDPFLVSRRSIATLYEYWTFVRLAGAVAAACGNAGPQFELFKPSTSGMSLVLRANASTRLKFETLISGERVLVDLFFNNEFRGNSWTRPMRPDASLLVRRPGDREVWLHFDAKYKVDWQRPFETGEVRDEEEAERTGHSKRTDLLKMHAYRDAIRDSAGSYVLFPGSQPAEYSLNDAEFLPGLGAFPLRPERAEEDVTALHAFIARVLRHVAGAGTRHRRATFWTARAYAGAGTNVSTALPPAGELPPADTSVLFGYVRSEEQWEWIHREGLYNVRGGDRPGAVSPNSPALDAPILLLYGRHSGQLKLELHRRAGEWQSVTGEALRRLAYPCPRGQAYLITSLDPLPSPPWLDTVDVRGLTPSGMLRGQPFSTSWLDLVLSTQDREPAPDSPEWTTKRP